MFHFCPGICSIWYDRFAEMVIPFYQKRLFKVKNRLVRIKISYQIEFYCKTK